MSIELEAATRLVNLKQGIEAATGETYPDITDGVNALISGYGQGGEDDWAFVSSIIERNIAQLNNDKITVVGNSAFRECRNLTKVNLPNATLIDMWCFNNCIVLKSVKLDKAKTINADAFLSCKELETAYLPYATGRLGYASFMDCPKLKSVYIPMVTELDANAFKASGLEFIDLPKCTRINGGAFENCTQLKTIVLRHSAVVSMGNVYVLNNTPFASNGEGGTVYVHAALVESYKTATNWVTFYEGGKCNFVAIEGSEYE